MAPSSVSVPSSHTRSACNVFPSVTCGSVVRRWLTAKSTPPSGATASWVGPLETEACPTTSTKVGPGSRSASFWISFGCRASERSYVEMEPSGVFAE
jgi:hypothetical protein